MKLYQAIVGDPDADVSAVFLHGITANHRTWSSLVPRLERFDWCCHLLDTRGHGLSPRPPSGYSLDDLSADIVDTVGTEPTVVIDHSFGGLLAAWATLGGVIRPQALVLEDPTHYVPSAEFADRRLDDSRRLPLDLTAFLASFPDWSDQDARERIAGLEQVSWPAIEAAFRDNAPWDIRHDLGQLRERCPVLYLKPAHSEWVRDSEVPHVRDVLGADHVVEVPHVGHGVHRDAPQLFVNAVLAFLARHGIAVGPRAPARSNTRNET